MKTKDLKARHVYYYTAGAEWVKVKYLRKTNEGYVFTADGVENTLTKQSVEQYIQEP
ncbi:hypothetical protein FACS1894169_14340 [Bacteroidia bacterium]|nr:hypothetical protein FACS1894169_14340 [Bacteroidia bacterium]